MIEEHFISRFSPNRTSPHDLEAITVHGDGYIAEAVESVRTCLQTNNADHLLFVGPRGAGKTHAITLIHHRISQAEDLREKLRVAWLNEDETSDSLLSLLLRIYRALSKEYPDEFPSSLTDVIFDCTDPDKATEMMAELLLKQLRNRTLLLLMENMDALFRDMSEVEQIQCRSLICEHPRFCTVATAQRLFQEVSEEGGIFSGFFQIVELQPFTVESASQLLINLARLRRDNELVSYILSWQGRSRIRALHHLTGGNPRLFVILSDFINRESLETLVGPFEELVDEQLTPYYQERLRWLPTLQRKIVEFLCASPKPVPVKEIARQLFTTHPSISGQLRDLRKLGYVKDFKRGRESLYELTEPLMRLSYQVKETRGRVPLRMLVDFLRIWYDHSELSQRLECCEIGSGLTFTYLTEALSLAKVEGNLRLQYLRDDAEGIDLEACDEAEIMALCDLARESGHAADWLKCGVATGLRGDTEDALAIFKDVIELSGIDPFLLAHALTNAAIAEEKVGSPDQAIEYYTNLIEMGDVPVDLVVMTLINRGRLYSDCGDCEQAIVDFTAVIHFDDISVDDRIAALFGRGEAHEELSLFEKAIDDYSALIQLGDASPEQIGVALINRAILYENIKESEKALSDYTSLIQMSAPIEELVTAYLNRGSLYGTLNLLELAIKDFTTLTQMEGISADDAAKALCNRATAYWSFGDFEQAAIDFNRLTEMSDVSVDLVVDALLNKVVALEQLGHVEQAISDCSSLMQMEDMPIGVASRLRFIWANLIMPRGAWDEALDLIRQAFSLVHDASCEYAGNVPKYIRSIFEMGQTVDMWAPKVSEFLEVYSENCALDGICFGLVWSIPMIEECQTMSADGLSSWCDVWADQIEKYPELEMPVRLMRIGVEYFTLGKNEAVLYELPEEERRILKQVLGLDKTNDNGAG